MKRLELTITLHEEEVVSFPDQCNHNCQKSKIKKQNKCFEPYITGNEK